MNCQNHPDVSATAYCRACGKPVCDACRRDAQGTVYCSEHAPAAPPPPSPPLTTPAPGPSPYTARPVYSDVSPGLALLLGFIPGVGAIYNSQYAKGLVHAVIFGIIISVLSSDAPGGTGVVFEFILVAWIFYMAFEAYHTALKRRNGEKVDEYSGLVNLRGGGTGPAAGVVLVLLGVLLLLNTLNIFNFAYLARYWPVVLIIAGVYLLYTRFTGHGASERGD